MVIPQQQRIPANPQESQVILNEIQAEVSTEAAPLLQFILRHAGLIMTTLGLFALLLAGTASYRWYAARTVEKAQTELATLTMRSAGQEKYAALAQFVTTAPEEVRMAALLELASAAIAITDYDKAAAAFAMLQKSDTAKPLGNIAAFNEAQVLLRESKYDAALTVLEALNNNVSEENRTVVLSVLAEAAQAAGKNDRAIAAYEQLSASNTGPEAEFFRFRAQTLRAAQAAPAVPSTVK